MSARYAFIAIVLPSVIMLGCNDSQNTIQTITPLCDAAPLELSPHCVSKTIGFKKCIIAVPAQSAIGNLYENSTGAPYANQIILAEKDVSLLQQALGKSFYDILTGWRYSLIGSPGDLFGDLSERSAELIVGAKIIDIQQNRIVTYDWLWSSKYITLKHESIVKINWQVFSAEEERVVYECFTQGYSSCADSFKCRSFPEQIPANLKDIDDALMQATKNLAVNEKFYKLTCISKSPGTTPSGDRKPLYLLKIKNYSDTLSSQSNEIRAATITIKTSGGHGSGFFISTDGYALTNAHVVGENLLVRARLATGRELLADVLMVDNIRDVALIRVEESHMMALPINSTQVKIGDKVFAMGTPLETCLSTTLTGGTVSAFREMRGLRFIQSDVNVKPGNSGGPLMDEYGNVIGICVSGKLLTFLGVSLNSDMGINYFIPIEDALNSLNIHIGDK